RRGEGGPGPGEEGAPAVVRARGAGAGGGPVRGLVLVARVRLRRGVRHGCVAGRGAAPSPGRRAGPGAVAAARRHRPALHHGGAGGTRTVPCRGAGVDGPWELGAPVRAVTAGRGGGAGRPRGCRARLYGL